MFLCACVRFIQISASVAEIILRKVKVGAHVKSRRSCKYGQRCGVRSEQRFCHVQRPHPPRSTALSLIVTTVESNCEIRTPAGKRSTGKRLLRLSFGISFTFGERVMLSVAIVNAYRFPWGRWSGVVYFRLASSLPIVTRHRSIAPSIDGPCACRPRRACSFSPGSLPLGPCRNQLVFTNSRHSEE